jgi:hypothetical protein
MAEFVVGEVVVERQTRWSPVRGEVTATDSGWFPFRPIAVTWTLNGTEIASGWHRPGNLEPANGDER